MLKMKQIQLNHGAEQEMPVNIRIENKGQEMENLEGKTVLDRENIKIDRNDKKMSMKKLLGCAEYYVFEAVTSHVSTEVYEALNVHTKYYFDIKKDSTGDEAECITEIAEMAMKNMCKINKVIVEETKKYLEIQEALFDLAREIYQEAVKAAVTSDDLLKCAEDIEFKLGDKKWAEQIVKDVEGKNNANNRIDTHTK